MTGRYRPLIPALIVEGPSDEPFLRQLIQRQLEETVADRALRATFVTPCEISPVRSTAQFPVLLAEARRLADRCDLLFVHRDHKEGAEADRLVDELSGLPASAAMAVVLVPRLMTESWVLADREALRRVQPTADLDAYPYSQPADVESANPSPAHPGHPKKVLEAVLSRARRREPADYFERLADAVDLAVLAKLPSYQRWLADTDEALKRKKYL
ncbi:DUF4276 family protein [Streptomyces sp. NPDC047002]|uniref:DUF4276 family protein n=1 Tax=Streptomyces sp. NPDC047002 TaxID=3155475 RepID=UPI0034555CFA